MSASAKAFVKAQQEMGKAIKSANNPHFRSNYADLGSVMDACYPALHANGFAVMQPQGRDEHGDYVETVFVHESGDMFSSRVYLLIEKQTMQGKGSAITYARRYGLISLAGVEDEDDDGNAASQRPQNGGSASPSAGPRDGRPDTRRADPEPSGEALAKRCVETVGKIRSLRSLDELKGFWESLNLDQKAVAADASVIRAKDEKKAELSGERRDAA